jgi:hypothetical protein
MQDWRGKTVLAVACGFPAPTGYGTPAELVLDVRSVTAQPADKFDLAVCASAGATFLDDATLAALAKSVRPGGEVSVTELVRLSTSGAGTAAVGALGALDKLRDADGLRRALLFAGLAPAASTPAPAPLTADAMAAVAALYPQLASAAAVGGAEAKDALLALASVLAPRLGMCTITCSRPAFKPGASFSLRSRAAVAAAPTVPSAPPPPSLPSQPAAPAPDPASAMAAAWSAAAAATGDDTDLIDEDELLAEEDRAKKEASSDCGTGNDGKRKACKNCSCGLRELIESEEGASGAPPPPKSACGNCSLGDAYRCAGCPHRGKPAFVDGSEVKVADAMEVSVAGTPGGGGGPLGTGGTGGIVMLAPGDTMEDDF